MEVGKRCGSNVPSPRKRGEGYFLVMWNGSTPFPACGERVPKAGEGPTEPQSLALQGGSSVAKRHVRTGEMFRGRTVRSLRSPLIRPLGTFSP
jgi:hypothetical protein